MPCLMPQVLQLSVELHKGSHIFAGNAKWFSIFKARAWNSERAVSSGSVSKSFSFIYKHGNMPFTSLQFLVQSTRLYRPPDSRIAPSAVPLRHQWTWYWVPSKAIAANRRCLAQDTSPHHPLMSILSRPVLSIVLQWKVSMQSIYA